MKKQFVCICLALAAGARISGQDNIATKSAISEFNKGEKEKAIILLLPPNQKYRTNYLNITRMPIAQDE